MEIDFKQLAVRIAEMYVESIELLHEEIRWHPDSLDETVALLKEVWNARGAADRAAIDASGDQDILDAILERLDR